MNIKQLHYFISVAEYLNFTKAAQHCFIAQTAISQHIMTLEKELGVTLFYRNNRTVQLTPAGKIFYNEVKLIVANLEKAIDKTQQANTSYEGTLAIGIMGPNEKKFLSELIRSFRHMYPNINLKIIQGCADKLQEAVLDGVLDMCFNLSFGIEKFPSLSWKKVYSDPICAIVHRDHPLANETRIRRSALANDSFVFYEHNETPFGKAMIQDCLNSGFIPNIIMSAPSTETLLLLINAEIGISVLPRCFETYANDNLRFVELEGEAVELIIEWLQNNPNPSIPLFLIALQDRINSFIHT